MSPQNEQHTAAAASPGSQPGLWPAWLRPHGRHRAAPAHERGARGRLAPFWLGEFGVANDSLAALGGSHAMSYGDGLGAGPLSQGYGSRWDNFTAYWHGTLDADWCTWHLSGTHVQGTEPSTNILQYNAGDRCWDGLYSQSWDGPGVGEAPAITPRPA